MKAAQYSPRDESRVNTIRPGMRIAFLTGATGFVGGHVARALVAEGWTVRALVRDPARAGAGLLAGLPVETVAGDLSEGGLPAAALSGVEAILHVAGLVKARSLEDYREVNVRGTRRLAKAAARVAPDALFLQVSSIAAGGPSRGGRPVSAADPARPLSWYGLSKREGEQVVEEVWKGPWHVIRPGVVYGPGDRGLLDYFRMAARGWVPVPAGDAKIQIIAVERAAVALARAAGRSDLAGTTSFLSDPEPVTLRELARLIGGLPERKARLFAVPDFAVKALGAMETAVEAVSRRSRPFNADKAKEILAGDWLCDAEPLARALALPPPRPLDEGLRAAWDWYRAAGWLPGRTL
jgi:nucleoside-diphosphate-sugar epimerase